MATDSVLGLFADPQQYQMQQQQAALQRGVDLAQLDPFQRATAQIYQGGYMAGGALGGALGGQDPQLQAMSTRQQVLKEYDPNTLEGLQGAAKALRDAGDLQGAYLLAQRADEAALKESQVAKNLREGKPAVPAAVQEYAIARQQGYQGSFLDYQKELKAAGRNVTSVNVDAKGEAEFSKELGKIDAKTVGDAAASRQGAVTMLKAVNELDRLDNAGLISGSFAGGRVGLSNFLNTTVGLSKDQAAKLANSQQYEKVAGDVILGNLGGKLGAGVSEGDRKFIESLVPRLETDPTARRELIKYMRGKAADVVTESNRMESYARKNKGLSGYEPKIDLTPPKPTTPAGGDGWSIKKVP